MIAWVYGCQRFLDNISEMFHLPQVLQVYWKIMWSFVSPLVLAAVVVLKWVQYKAGIIAIGRTIFCSLVAKIKCFLIN